MGEWGWGSEDGKVGMGDGMGDQMGGGRGGMGMTQMHGLHNVSSAVFYTTNTMHQHMYQHVYKSTHTPCDVQWWENHRMVLFCDALFLLVVPPGGECIVVTMGVWLCVPALVELVCLHAQDVCVYAPTSHNIPAMICDA